MDGKKETTLSLGERLRSARKARALTLQQAAFTLRLEEPVLRALEDDHYEVLGAAVFVRGHLRAYAKLLGLSEESVIAAYRNSDPSADSPPRVTRELERPITTTPGTVAILAAVGFVIVAIVLMYLLGQDGDTTPTDSRVEPAQRVVPSIEIVPRIETAPAPDPGPAPEPLPLAPAGTAPAAPSTEVSQPASAVSAPGLPETGSPTPAVPAPGLPEPVATAETAGAPDATPSPGPVE